MNEYKCGPKRGIGLVEILIAIGVASIAAIAVSQLYNYASAGRKSVSAKADFQNVAGLVAKAIAQPDRCQKLFSGLSFPLTGSGSALTQLPVNPPPPEGPFVRSGPVGRTENGLEITAIRIRNSTVPAANFVEGGINKSQVLGYLRVEGETTSPPQQRFVRSFVVSLVVVGTNVESCVANRVATAAPNQAACEEVGGIYTAGPPEACRLSTVRYPALAMAGFFIIGDGRLPSAPSSVPSGVANPDASIAAHIAGGGCELRHPMTNACSCPTNFHPVRLDPTCEIDCNLRWSIRVVCVRNDIPCPNATACS